jgi:hypothetical protein
MCHTSAPPPSSTLTTLRALFMLACLVAIPAVALRGTSLGGMLRRFLLEKLDKPAERTSARADLEEAPPFVSPASGLSSPTTSPPVGGYDPSASAMGRLPGPAATAGQEDAAPWGPPPGISAPRANERPPEAPLSASWRGPQTGALGGEIRPSAWADRRAPSDPVVAAEYMDRSSVGPAVAPAVESSPPAAYEQRPDLNSAPARGAATDDARGSRAVDQFMYIQQRLRELGANYYLLENWGDQGECYRFHCRVAVAGNADFTRHFECTDRDPLRAMTRVLGDVETWRQSGLAWGPQTATPIDIGRLPAPPAGSGGSPTAGYIR